MRPRTAVWLKAALIRAVKTVCQTAAATIGTAALLAEISWPAVLSASLLAGLLSLLTSAAGIPEVTLSLTAEEEKANAGYDGENGI